MENISQNNETITEAVDQLMQSVADYQAFVRTTRSYSLAIEGVRESVRESMKTTLIQQLTDALETARIFAAELIDSDYTASVCLQVHARVIAGILTDLDTL